MNFMRVFNGAGALVFSLVAIDKAYTTFKLWDAMYLSSKVAGVAFTIFFLMVVGVFYSQFRAMGGVTAPQEDQIEQMLKEVE